MGNKGPYLVLGLGNPGKTYQGTRHNAGFRVIDEIASRFQLRLKRKWRISSHYCRHEFNGKDVIYAKPRTYMNRSGLAVLAAMKTFGVSTERLIVVVDDIHLPIGTLRFRRKGSDGGHNGLLSVINMLGSSDFARCRIGIGCGESTEIIDYVLGEFNTREESVLTELLPLAADAVLEYIENGIDIAMNKYNTVSADTEENGNKSKGLFT